MKLRGRFAALVIALLGLVGGAVAVPAAGSAATGDPYCGITWGSGDKSTGSGVGAPLLITRTGQHDCYDRLVFEFDGPASAAVNYGEAYTQGRGDALSPYTAGGALLNVVLRADAYDHVSGDHVVNVLGYRTLRDVVFGGSFEGYTTFAVGVRARLPFQVFTLAGPGTHTRIVLDVAHQWQQ